jgi:hypothetical protein
MSHPTVPDFGRLERVIEVLCRGDWRKAMETLRRCGDAGPHEAVVAVLFCLRCVCRCMWLQCAFGEVERALGEIERAEARLARLDRASRATGGGRVTLLAEPGPERPEAHLVWATTRLVLRERTDLEAVRAIFESIRRGAPELVHATVEHLTWVEFDPWTARLHPHDQELLGLDDDAYARFRTGNPRDISTRATHLRHLAAVRGGSVTRRTWHRLGGYPAVREAALLVLAEEGATRGRTDWPIRLGRLRAYQYARRLADDTPA